MLWRWAFVSARFEALVADGGGEREGRLRPSVHLPSILPHHDRTLCSKNRANTHHLPCFTLRETRAGAPQVCGLRGSGLWVPVPCLAERVVCVG